MSKTETRRCALEALQSRMLLAADLPFYESPDELNQVVELAAQEFADLAQQTPDILVSEALTHVFESLGFESLGEEFLPGVPAVEAIFAELTVGELVEALSGSEWSDGGYDLDSMGLGLGAGFGLPEQGLDGAAGADLLGSFWGEGGAVDDLGGMPDGGFLAPATQRGREPSPSDVLGGLGDFLKGIRSGLDNLADSVLGPEEDWAMDEHQGAIPPPKVEEIDPPAPVPSGSMDSAGPVNTSPKGEDTQEEEDEPRPGDSGQEEKGPSDEDTQDEEQQLPDDKHGQTVDGNPTNPRAKTVDGDPSNPRAMTVDGDGSHPIAQTVDGSDGGLIGNSSADVGILLAYDAVFASIW